MSRTNVNVRAISVFVCLATLSAFGFAQQAKARIPEDRPVPTTPAVIPQIGVNPAFVNNGCIFGSRNVTYQDWWNNTPSLDQAATSWNTTNLSFARTSSYSPDVWTYTNDWGNTGWYGLTTGPNGGPCGDVRINTFQDPTHLPPTSWKAVVTHEFGHAAGLAHNTSRFPCEFGGSSNVAVMDEGIGYAFTSSCIRDYPQADDIAGVNNKYPLTLTAARASGVRKPIISHMASRMKEYKSFAQLKSESLLATELTQVSDVRSVLLRDLPISYRVADFRLALKGSEIATAIVPSWWDQKSGSTVAGFLQGFTFQDHLPTGLYVFTGDGAGVYTRSQQGRATEYQKLDPGSPELPAVADQATLGIATS
jgi:hypothetical protein